MAQLLVESILKAAAGICRKSVERQDIRVLQLLVKAKLTRQFIREMRNVHAPRKRMKATALSIFALVNARLRRRNYAWLARASNASTAHTSKPFKASRIKGEGFMGTVMLS